MSVTASINDIPLTYLFSKLDDKVIEVGLDTSESVATKKLKCKVVERDLTRSEIILNTIIIRATRVTEIVDHG